MKPTLIQGYLANGREVWIPDEARVPFGPQQDYRVVMELRGSPYTRAVMALGVTGMECVGWMEIPDDYSR